MGPSLTFAELGLGSLEWILMRESVRQTLGLQHIPLHLFYMAPSVEALTAELCKLLKNRCTLPPNRTAADEAAGQRLPQEPVTRAQSANGAANGKVKETEVFPMVSNDVSGASKGSQMELQSGQAPSWTRIADPTALPPIPKMPPQVIVGEGSQVSSTVRFEGPVTIGKRTILEGDLQIGGGCEIQDDVRIKGRVRLGSNCRLLDDVRIQGEVTLGDANVLHNQVIVVGPVEAGSHNVFYVRCFVGKVDGSRCGQIQIGNHNYFDSSSEILQPRGKLFPTWLPQMEKSEPIPSLTLIGSSVHIHKSVCHDCVVEDGCVVNGGISGYCHLMPRSHVAPMAVLHQFTTLGTGAFATLGVKVAADLLPYTVVDKDARCFIDTVALMRAGVENDKVLELESFYQRNFTQPAATYLRTLSDDIERQIQGKWFQKSLTDFFRIRNSKRDMRPLQIIVVQDPVEAGMAPRTRTKSPPRSPSVSGGYLEEMT